MVRYLTERLPVMVTPRWVDNEVRPIAVRDVLGYLVGALAKGPTFKTVSRHPLVLVLVLVPVRGARVGLEGRESLRMGSAGQGSDDRVEPREAAGAFCDTTFG